MKIIRGQISIVKNKDGTIKKYLVEQTEETLEFTPREVKFVRGDQLVLRTQTGKPDRN